MISAVICVLRWVWHHYSLSLVHYFGSFLLQEMFLSLQVFCVYCEVLLTGFLPTFFFGDAVALLHRESCTKFCHIHSAEVAFILFYCHFEAKSIKRAKRENYSSKRSWRLRTNVMRGWQECLNFPGLFTSHVTWHYTWNLTPKRWIETSLLNLKKNRGVWVLGLRF